MELPTLFKQNTTGGLQFWKIGFELEDGTDFGVIVTTFGQENTDNPQTTRDVIREGKNLGKKNETTPGQQAVLECQAKWEKMKKKGYVEDRAQAAAGESELEGNTPMLAHVYGTLFQGEFTPEQAHKMTFPCAVQPKLDGFRCMPDSEGTLRSKTQKPFNSVPHIVEAIKARYNEIPPLDGELYNHDYKESFEKISSMVTQKKGVHPDHKAVQYHVYDIAIPGLGFSERHEILKSLFEDLPEDTPLRLVETVIVDSHETLLNVFREFRNLGYEGAMVRKLDAEYEPKRSYSLLKLKEFLDAEFRIVGIKEGRGKLAGHVGSFVCLTETGTEFEAKMEGDLGKLKEFFENWSLWKDKLLTVKFQGYTGTNRVPRFPVGIRIREAE